MQDDDFFDFIVFSEMLFPDEPDKTFECPFCATVIEGDEKVEWVDKENKIFRCPECDKEISIE